MMLAAITTFYSKHYDAFVINTSANFRYKNALKNENFYVANYYIISECPSRVQRFAKGI